MPTTTTPERSKQRTVTLTSAPPVRIQDDQWPIVLQVARHEDEGAVLTRRRWIKVRRHADGRLLVYGGLDTTMPHEHFLRGGLLLDPDDDLGAAIIQVASRVHASELVDEAMACLGNPRRFAVRAL